MSYHWSFADTSWAQSDIRKMLNDGLLESMTGVDGMDHQAVMGTPSLTDVPDAPIDQSRPASAPEAGADDGTTDELFLLSLDESLLFFPTNGSRVACDTTSLTCSNTQSSQQDSCAWWLRSPGVETFRASFVETVGASFVGAVGSAGDSNDVLDASGGVRPAFWLNVQS
jgi:hypothetical protein